jgi:hypothetical protein
MAPLGNRLLRGTTHTPRIGYRVERSEMNDQPSITTSNPLQHNVVNSFVADQRPQAQAFTVTPVLAGSN